LIRLAFCNIGTFVLAGNNPEYSMSKREMRKGAIF
jgi:hypothetical protein